MHPTRPLNATCATLWLTGLSGAGKSTLAYALKQQLLAEQHPVYVLDGDQIRRGLNRDLGFSPADRTENIRRTAEVAKLFNDAGFIVIAALISPYRQDRAMAQTIIGPERFIEAYLCTDLATCEERDPKGLYRQARQGKIAGFTGVDAPYEAPASPDIILDTAHLCVTECVATLMRQLARRLGQDRVK